MALLDLVDDIVRVEFVDMVSGQLCAQVGGAEVAERASMVVSWSWGVVHNDGFAAILVFFMFTIRVSYGLHAQETLQ